MDKLPEELRFQPTSDPHSATLYNVKTQPVSFLASNLVRFQIPNSGIMNSGSAYIEFAVAPNFNGSSFPLSVGSHAVISRARLMTQSGRIIADQRNFNKKQTVEKTFRTMEYNRFVAPYLDGSWMSYTISQQGLTDGAGAELKNKLIVAGDPVAVAANGYDTAINDSMSWARPQVIRPYKGSENGHLQQFRVTMTELFPMLYSHQLPVQIMEQLYVELDFEPDDARGKVFVPTVDNGAEWTAGDNRLYAAGTGVVQSSCFFISDHIIYDSPEVMARIEAHAEKNGGLAFPFTDYTISLLSVTNNDLTSATDLYETTRQLGCNEYKLCSIKTIEQANNLTGIGIPTIYGDYHSSTPQGSIKSLNYAINDVNLYPLNDAFLPVQYDRLSQIYDHINPGIPRPVYGCDIAAQLEPVLNTQYLQVTPLNNGIVGAMNVQAVYLKDMLGHELQNGNQAVRVFAKYKSNANKGNLATGFNSQFFIEYKRELAVSPTGAVMINEYS